MNIFLQNKKVLIISIFTFILMLAFLISIVLPKPNNKTNNNIPLFQPKETPTISSNPQEIRVINIQPPLNTALKPDQTQIFQITFNKPINMQQIQVSLHKKNITNNNPPELVNFDSVIKENDLFIAPKELIIGYGDYEITIIDINTNMQIFKASYLSDKNELTPAPKNNPDLIPFLPYETTGYRLSYNKSRNIYVFNFKYNPNSTDKLDTQYEKAKQDAKNYIQSKGINPTSIIIEWRYS